MSGWLGSSRGSSSTTLTTPRVRVPRHVAQLVDDYFDCAARSGASARRAARRAVRRQLRLRRASGCLDTLRGSLSTTSPTPCVQVPRHVVLLVEPLVVDYFAYAGRPGASTRHAAHLAARRRLLRLRRTSGCLSTSRGSSLTTSPTPLVIDYFAYAVRPGASAHHAARCRLLRLRRESRCLGTSRGSSRRSSSTTSPTLRIRVPQHVTWLVSPIVVDYYAYAARPGASARRAARD
jgi:hypothetical protein